MSTPFVGEIRPVAFNFAPKGWALCNGQLLPISQNTALFALLGTFYGGDGRTTFALPNLQGRIPIGTGQGAGLSPRNPGDAGGEPTVTLLESELPAHTHLLNAVAATGTLTDPAGALLAEPRVGRAPIPAYAASAAGGSQLSDEAVTVVGDTTPHENMPPYLVVNYVIALTGEYPLRS